MRTIIIGDVHGCYREMMELLSLIGPSANDQIYFTGDLINKGPNSKMVIDTVRQNGYRTVMGNHEWSYLKRYFGHREKNPFSPFYISKKHPLLDDLLRTLSEEENCWLASLPLYIDTPDFLMVHAGILSDRPLPQHSPFEILNIRTRGGSPWHEEYQGDKLIVYGHWARQGLMIKGNSIGLDSGCVYGNELSALILPERKIVQVKSQTSIL